MAQSGRKAATWLAAGILVGLAARGEAERDPVLEELELALAASRTAARAVARVAPSIATVRAFGKGRDAYGAGIVVTRDGRVLTAQHVVAGATALALVYADGIERPARVRAEDPAVDLALLDPVGVRGEEFTPAAFGRDELLGPGATVLTVANPFGVGPSVSRGVLSARDRRGVVDDNAAPLLQTDAAINPGSSGGALIDLRGEVVGMVNAILTRTGGNQGLGFAVPASELRRALPWLLQGKVPARAWLGVRVLDPVEGATAGLQVVSVRPDGPAGRAGLRAGDLLLRLGSRPLRDLGDLRESLAELGIGETRRAVVRRGAQRIEFRVTVEQRPGDS